MSTVRLEKGGGIISKLDLDKIVLEGILRIGGGCRGLFIKGDSRNGRTKKNIDRFLSFSRKQFESISSIQLLKPTDYPIFKRILYVGIIDTLSKTVYPTRKENRKRFTSFIKNFSNWKYCEKVSLPHLIRVLERTPDPEFSDLSKFAYSRFDAWAQGEIIELDKDPDYTEVQKLWPKHKEHFKPIENVQLDFLQHANLLYTYRNLLIHEMRKPGYGIDLGNPKEPFYHSMTHVENVTNTWELVYPVIFFESLCKTVLEELEKYYINNRIDPYHLFTFGTFWIAELNR